SSRRRHTRSKRDWSSDVCSSDLGVMIYLAYNLYARRIDRDVLRPDPKKATPARMYMDGVDFMPTSRSVLYGYHFKSIAAAGPIRSEERRVGKECRGWGWQVCSVN